MRKILIDLYLRLVSLEDYIKKNKTSDYNDTERLEYYRQVEDLLIDGYIEITKLHDVIIKIEELTKDEVERVVKLQDEIIYN